MALGWRQGDDGIREDLVARVDAVDRRVDRLLPGEIALEIETIRRIAARNGIGPAVTVLHALDSALSRGERGPLVHDWLAILRDAVGCRNSDPRTCETFAAACTVRLAR